tara:strand:+ start:107 stop:292 length:186 start_codon:yes stop_codon:yes gene_type:complete
LQIKLKINQILIVILKLLQKPKVSIAIVALLIPVICEASLEAKDTFKEQIAASFDFEMIQD